MSVTDHLTCKETLDFWHRYFSDQPNNSVNVDAFCDAVQSEYSINVFKRVLDELPGDAYNEDDLMADFYTDLQNKVSIDQDFVSLNALELFTRKNGMTKAI